MSAPDSSVWKATIYGHARSQQVLNSTYWRVSAPNNTLVSAGEEEQIATTIEQKWKNNVRGYLQEDYVYDRVLLQSILTSDLIVIPDSGDPPETYRKLRFGSTVETSAEAGIQGLVTGDSLPLTVSLVCHWLTGEYGRRKRGRIKLGPIAEDNTTDDKFSSVVAAAIKTSLETFITPFTLTLGPGRVIEPCIFSQAQMFDEVAGTLARGFTTPVTAVRVQTILGTQRTRKLRENFL